ARDAFFFKPESKIRWIAPDRTNYSSSNFRGESEEQEIRLYYYLGQAAQNVAFTVYQGTFPISTIEAPGEAGLHRVAWDMRRRVERTAEEIAQLQARGGGR